MAAEGTIVPALREEPIVPDRWEFCWRAYVLLNKCRPSGFGPSPIPLSEIRVYLLMFGYPDPEELISVVKDLDSHYLEHASKKANAANGGAG